MIYIGIDNGLSGGIVAINEKQEVILLEVMPVIKGKKTEYDINQIYNILQNYSFENCYVVLEKSHVRPISGKRACFMTGFGYGIIQGMLSALNISYEIVDPKVWQKELITGLGNDTKTASIQFCKKKFPTVDLTPTERSVKPHDGLSDALCMAVYCYRLNR